ncbi:hypothetical protein J3F84DRAFT_324439 [Trichoderma pleuroticola]
MVRHVQRSASHCTGFHYSGAFSPSPNPPFFAFCTPYENQGWMDAFVLVCSGGRSAIIPHQFSGSPVVLPPAWFFFPLLFPLCAWRPLVSFFSRRFSSFSGVVPDRKDCAKHADSSTGSVATSLSQTSVSPCLIQIQNPKIQIQIHLPDIADPCIGVYVHASSHPYRPPGFCRVRSATPHLDGRHPESAKKGSSIAITAHPQLQDPFLSLLCVDSTCESAPPGSPHCAA